MPSDKAEQLTKEFSFGAAQWDSNNLACWSIFLPNAQRSGAMSNESIQILYQCHSISSRSIFPSFKINRQLRRKSRKSFLVLEN